MISASILSTPGASGIYSGGLTVTSLFSQYPFFVSPLPNPQTYVLLAVYTRVSPCIRYSIPSILPFSSSENIRTDKVNKAGWTDQKTKDYKGPTPEIVSFLAENVRGKLKSTYTVSESGTAGPTGGSTRNRTP